MGVVCAPAIVRAGSLMPIKSLPLILDYTNRDGWVVTGWDEFGRWNEIFVPAVHVVELGLRNMYGPALRNANCIPAWAYRTWRLWQHLTAYAAQQPAAPLAYAELLAGQKPAAPATQAKPGLLQRRLISAAP